MEKTKIIIGALIGLLVLSAICIGGMWNSFDKTRSENDLFRRIINLPSGDTSLSIEAEEYGEISSLKYEFGDYKDAEINCKLSRDKLSAYIQTLKKDILIIEEYEESIFRVYTDLLREEITIRENEYEACEWLESACRHYDYYYSESADYDDISYERGGEAVDESNKKISARDDAVRRYNYLLEDYKLELEKITQA